MGFIQCADDVDSIHFEFWDRETREGYLNFRTLNESRIRKEELHRMTSKLVLSFKMEKQEKQYICIGKGETILVFKKYDMSKQAVVDSKKRTDKDDPVKELEIRIEAELKNNDLMDPEEETGQIEVETSKRPLSLDDLEMEGEKVEEPLLDYSWKREQTPLENKENNEKKETDKHKAIIIFPYTIKTEEKVELIKQTNVWIAKADLQTIKEKCDCFDYDRCADRHRTMTRLLLTNLLGSENLKHMTIRIVPITEKNGKVYTTLPAEVYFAVRRYVIQDCKTSLCQTRTLRSYTFRRYISSIFANVRIPRVQKPVRSHVEGKEEEEFPLDDGKKEQKQHKGEAIIFPYTIKTEDKVELVKQTNIWITRTDLLGIERNCEIMTCRCEDRHKTMTRLLLFNLLGRENIKNMGVRGIRSDHVVKRHGKVYTALPEEVQSAVRKYVMQDCKTSVCHRTILKYDTYRRFISRIFNNVRIRNAAEYVRRNTTDLNKNEFPYRVWNEKKVELIPYTNVWIYEAFVNTIKETWKNAPRLMIQNLMRHLLGPENMKCMALTENLGTVPLCKVVYSVIRTFVTENCSPDAQLSIKEFEDCINETFDKARENFQQIVVDTTCTTRLSAKTVPENDFLDVSAKYFGSSLANTFQNNFAMTAEIEEPKRESYDEPQKNITHDIKRRKLSSDNDFSPQAYTFPEATYHLQQYAIPGNFYHTLPQHLSRYYANCNFN